MHATIGRERALDGAGLDLDVAERGGRGDDPDGARALGEERDEARAVELQAEAHVVDERDVAATNTRERALARGHQLRAHGVARAPTIMALRVDDIAIGERAREGLQAPLEARAELDGRRAFPAA